MSREVTLERPVRARTSWLFQAALVARKDLRLELATGEVVTTSGFFAVLVAVIASLAFYAGPDTTERVAPGVMWLSITFASVLGLSRAWQREREEGALDGLVVSPISRSAIFAGKAVGVFAFVLAIELLVVPVTAVLFDVNLVKYGAAIAIFAVLANAGTAASGTLFGVMTVRTRARDLVLAAVLLPLLAPSLGSAIAATRELFGGVPLSELGDYVKLMLVFDLVFALGGLGLFGLLIEG